MDFIAFVKLAIQLLPLVSQLVEQAESLFPQAGAGAHKLEIVKGALQGAYSTANQAEGAFEQIWPTVNTMVTNIVAAKNAIAGGQPAAA